MILFGTFFRAAQRLVHRNVYPPPGWYVLGYVEHDMQKFLVISPEIRDELWDVLVSDALNGRM
jgi:hypothetical protein